MSMNEKKLFLHIGYPKTGTTAIQDNLYLNRELLKEHGVLYPNTAIHVNAHHQLPWCIKDDKRRNANLTVDQIMSTLKEEVNGSTGDKVIISSEGLVFAVDPKHIRELLKDLFSEITLIIYLRDPLEWIQSDYNQGVKAHRNIIDTFDGFLGQLLERKNNPLNFHSVVKKWADVFGFDHTRIRVYTKEKNILDDFLDVVGVVKPKAWKEPERKDSNPSLPFHVLEFGRVLNQLQFSFEQKKEIFDNIFQNEPIQKDKTLLYVSDENMEKFNDIIHHNARLLENMSEDDKEDYNRLKKSYVAQPDAKEQAQIFKLQDTLQPYLKYIRPNSGQPKHLETLHQEPKKLAVSKKHNLKHFIESKQDVDMRKVLEIMSVPKDRQNRYKLPSEYVGELIQSIRTTNDLIAVATIMRRFGDRNDTPNIDSITAKLENVTFDLPEFLSDKRRPTQIQNITIIASTPTDSTLKTVFSVASALLTQDEIKTVRILFTAEWEWNYWAHVPSAPTPEKLKKNFSEEYGSFLDPTRIETGLHINMGLNATQVFDILGDIVVRMEGVAFFKTAYLYGKMIHKLFPVTTLTFSSHVTELRNTDILVTRSKSKKSEKHIHFLTPLPKFKIEKPTKKTRQFTVVTVYAQDRIKKGLLGMSDQNWAKIEELFQTVPESKWILAGASNINEAVAAIPAHIIDTYPERIHVLGYSDLNELYQNADVFLTFSKMFGGGGGAMMAVAQGVPVLVENDHLSDISNALPEELHCQNFADAIDKAIGWSTNTDAWHEFIDAQQSSLLNRMDYEAKGSELLAILNDVFENYKK